MQASQRKVSLGRMGSAAQPESFVLRLCSRHIQAHLACTLTGNVWKLFQERVST